MPSCLSLRYRWVRSSPTRSATLLMFAPSRRCGTRSTRARTRRALRAAPDRAAARPVRVPAGLPGGTRALFTSTTPISRAEGKQRGGLDHVLQFGEVAGPVVHPQGVQRAGTELSRRDLLRLDTTLQDQLRQLRHVLWMLPQVRHAQLDRADGREQARVEAAFGDHARQRLRGRADQPGVVALQLGHLAQQVALLRGREIADPVQEQSTFSRLTYQIVGRVVEHSKALRRHPGRVGKMQETGAQSLAATGLAGQQNRCLQILDGLQPLAQLRDERRLAQVGHVEHRLRRGRRFAQRLTDRGQQLLQRDRLLQECQTPRSGSPPPRYRWSHGRTSSPPAW